MAIFKPVVMSHRKRTDNTYNIKIRLSHNKINRYIGTPWSVKAKDLNSKGEIKNQYYLDKCDDIIREYRTLCEQFGLRLKGMTCDEVIAVIEKYEENKRKAMRASGDPKDLFVLDFIKYVRDIANRLTKDGREGTAKNYRTSANVLAHYVGSETLDIGQVTTKFLKGLLAYLQDKHKGGRAVSQYMGTLRTAYKLAQKEFNDEDERIIPLPHNPFAKLDMPKQPRTRKRALDKDLLLAIFNVEVPKTHNESAKRFELARDVFMLSFMLVGMNSADLYDATKITKDRITYERMKTRTRRADRAEISIKIEEEAEELVNKYRDPSGKRVFKFYNRYSTKDTFNTALNKGLKVIGEALGIDALQFYAARHSWATMAVNDAGVDKYTVHEALNHTDPSMATTDIYIRKSWKNVDIANRKVLDYLFGKSEE